MNPIKIQATKMHKNQQLLHNLFIYSLTALASSSLCFSPILHPLFSCIKVLLVLPTTEITSLFFSSKFLFIIGNFIFIILVSESKISTPYTTSISDFYCKRLDNLLSVDMMEERVEKFFREKIISCESGEPKFEEWIEEKQDVKEKLEEWTEEKQDVEKEIEDGIQEMKQDVEEELEEWIEEIQDVDEELDGEGELEEWIEEKKDVEEELDGEGFGLPVEELNKRVDNFIARVQKQRSLELLTYCSE